MTIAILFIWVIDPSEYQKLLKKLMSLGVLNTLLLLLLGLYKIKNTDGVFYWAR
jgi:hypothetical protein